MRASPSGVPVNEDFQDLLAAFVRAEVRFLVVGAYAMAVHGVPRATGDLDLWIDRSDENASRAWTALDEFGAPTEALGVRREDLSRPDTVIQIGQPPRRIDVMTDVTGLTFQDAWADRVLHDVGGIPVPFLGIAALIRNKRATDRPKDHADIALLEGREGAAGE